MEQARQVSSANKAAEIQTVATGQADRGPDPTSQPAPIATRAVNCYLSAAPSVHAPRTAKLESSVAKPNVPPMARPAPSDPGPPHLPLPATFRGLAVAIYCRALAAVDCMAAPLICRR